ncbi:hypothetical protein PspKH34_14670 [Parageobacillus sp. KH3-4]|jgi:hypothetical protein|nr:hypothetical protein PspKH34_14670 [Parageobacillus sp. KH3-4]
MFPYDNYFYRQANMMNKALAIAEKEAPHNKRKGKKTFESGPAKMRPVSMPTP